MPIVILVAVLGILFTWLKRKFEGRDLSDAHLLLTDEELRLIEEASTAGKPILINDATVLLKPFNAERQHIHPVCGSCPDELHLNDVKDRPCLSASRNVGGALWKTTAMEPIVFGLLGHTNSDLTSLQVGDTAIGRADASTRTDG